MKRNKSFVAFMLAVLLLLSCTSSAHATVSADTPPFSVNENGDTYGDFFQTMEYGYDPDLIRAQGEDGTIGYVRIDELELPFPESPEAALAMQSAQEASGYTGRYINLYSSDGVTVIGRFFVSADIDDPTSSNAKSEITYSSPNTLNMPSYTATGWSTIQSVSRGIRYSTLIQSNQVTQSGWLGGKARLYSEDGTLVDSTDYKYSGTSTTQYTVTKTYRTSSGYFYSWGIGCAWDNTSNIYGRMDVGKTAYRSPN